MNTDYSTCAFASRNFETMLPSSKPCAGDFGMPCPTWRYPIGTLVFAREMLRGDHDEGITAHNRAVSNIQYIADQVDNRRLRNIFLSSDAIRDALRQAGEQICPE